MKFKFIFFTLCATTCLSLSSMAQTARQVLDETAQMLKSKNVVEAQFEGTQFDGLKESAQATGKIILKGDKFKIESEELTSWYDGRTQWTLMKGSDEVNVNTPDKAEMQRMNPYTFINLYKNGYDLKLSSVLYHGQSCHEVRLLAQKKEEAVQLLIAVIDKKNAQPLSIRIKDNRGTWLRIRISNLRTLHKVNDDLFKFDSRQYPGVEIIDLR